MRTLTYAGGTIVTTDRVATALVQLTAALARRGLAEAVRIPVYADGSPTGDDAELVVGVGAPLLSVMTAWPEADPASDDAAAALLRLLEQLGGAPREGAVTHYDRVLDDPEFALPTQAGDGVEPPIRLRPRTRPR